MISCSMSKKSFSQIQIQDIKYFSGFLTEFESILPTSNGGFMCLGGVGGNGPFNYPISAQTGARNILLINLDANLNVIWAKSLGGSKNDYLVSAKSTKDGGYILCSGTYSNDSIFSGPPFTINVDHHLALVKIDSQGNHQWTSLLSGDSTSNFHVFDVVESSYGDYYMCGMYDSTGGDFGTYHHGGYYTYDWFIAKYNANGNRIWLRNKGGNGADEGGMLVADKQGGCYFAGNSSSADFELSISQLPQWTSAFNGYLSQIDSAGNTLWGKTYGGTDWDKFDDLILDSATNSLVLCGYTISEDYDLQNRIGFNEDYWAVRTDLQGNLKWSKWWGGSGTDNAWAVGRNPLNGNYLVGGYAYSKNGDLDSIHTALASDNDAFLISIDTNGNLKNKKQIGGDKSEAVINIVSNQNEIYVCGGTNSNNYDFSTHTFDGSQFIMRIVDWPLATINFSETDAAFIVYPNPTTDLINLQYSGYKQTNNIVSITNISGKLIYSDEFNISSQNQKKSIDMSQSANGVYLISITNSKGLHKTFKFIKN